MANREESRLALVPRSQGELELPDAFIASSTEAEVRLAHKLIEDGLKLIKRGDDLTGERKVELAFARLDRLVALFDRPRNIPGGRQVCSVCQGHHVMPNGRCPEHGGE